MQVSLISDLHLEFGSSPHLPGGELLLMAGDIFTAHPLREFRQDANSRKARARYQRFCQEQLSKYQKVLYIQGNHESYSEIIDETPGLIRDMLAAYAPNTVLLDNEAYVIDFGDYNVSVLGTTLWAPSGVGTPDEWRIRNAMRDFSVIRTPAPPPEGMTYYGGLRTFQPSDAARLHDEAVAWLKQELPKHERAIVLSHHAPCMQSAAGIFYNTLWLDSAYASDQVDLILANPQIEVWSHGHSHWDVDYKIGETRIIANHRGYPTESTFKRFDPGAKDFDI